MNIILIVYICVSNKLYECDIIYVYTGVNNSTIPHIQYVQGILVIVRWKAITNKSKVSNYYRY